MPIHSVPKYSHRSQGPELSDEHFNIRTTLAGESQSNYFTAGGMVSRLHTDTLSCYGSVEDSQSIYLTTSLGPSQWSSAHNMYSKPYGPASHQYIPQSLETKFVRNSNGKALQVSHCDWGQSQDSVPKYSSVTRPRRFPQEVNDTVKAAMNSLGQNSSTTRRLSSTPLPNTTEEAPNCPVLNYYNSYDSELSSVQMGMSSLIPFYEQTRDYSPALSSYPFSQTAVAENYIAVSADAPNAYDQHDASLPGNDEDTDGGLSSEPYAQLIYRALKSVPTHRMVLKEIYEWFEKNTDKAKNNSSKGWQNSIRHNLSMNGAFTKVDQSPPSDDSKKGFLWVLEQSALVKGVESTTRYRKLGPNKKIGRTEPAAAQRQRSGAKGGKAARKSAKMRRMPRNGTPQKMERFEEASSVSQPPNTIQHVGQLSLETDLNDASVPMFYPTPSSTIQSSFTERSPYSFEGIAGCVTGLGNEPLFCDPSEKVWMDPPTTLHAFCGGECQHGACNFDTAGFQNWA